MYDDATLSKPILKNHVHTMADCLMANFEDCQTKSLLDEVKLHTNWLDNYSGEFHRHGYTMLWKVKKPTLTTSIPYNCKTFSKL